VKASVIIATFNREKLLVETLLDLARQRLMGDDDFEVVVADNASRDGTREKVEDLQKSFPVPLVYLHEPKQGKSHALYHALTKARGEVLLFTDDDTRLPQDWIAQYLKVFRETGAEGVAGPVRPVWLEKRPEWLSDRLVKQMGMVDHRPERFVIDQDRYSFIGPNCAYTRRLFDKIGSFLAGDPAEDVEFFLRAFRSGHKLVWEPAVAVGHKVQPEQMTWAYLVKRFVRQGRGNASGVQENERYRGICRIPFWVLKLWCLLPFQAAGLWLKGDRDEARWRWLQIYLYGSMIRHCFDDWLHRRPQKRSRIKVAAPGSVLPKGKS